MTKTQIIIAILIFTLALAVRVYKFNEVPQSLYVDEVAMYIDGASVAKLGTDMHGNPWWQTIYPSYGDYKQAAYIWLVSAGMALFGLHEWVVRLPSLIAGLGTVLVAAGLGFVLFNQTHKAKVQTALFSALVVAISPWSILFSRVGFEGHLGQFFLSASVLLYVLSFKNLKWAWVAMIFGALSTYSYFSVRFVFPVVIVSYFIFYYLSNHIHNKISAAQVTRKLVTVVAIPLLVYFILLNPLLSSPYYEQANKFRLVTASIISSDEYILNSNRLKELAGSTFIDRLVFHRYVILGRELLKNYSDHLSFSYLFIEGDSNLRHGTGKHGVFLLGLLPFFLLGLYSLMKKDRAVFGFLLVWWFAALLPASVPETTPHTLRSLNAYVPVSLIIAYGGWYFFNATEGLTWLKNRVALYRLVTLLLVVGVVFYFIQFQNYYFSVYPTTSREAWFSASKQSSVLAIEMRNNKPIYTFNLGDKYYLWLIAYSDLLGKNIPVKLKDGFIIKESDLYHNDILVQDIPADTSFIAVTDSEKTRDDLIMVYKEKIIQTNEVEMSTGQKIYVFEIQ